MGQVDPVGAGIEDFFDAFTCFGWVESYGAGGREDKRRAALIQDWIT